MLVVTPYYNKPTQEGLYQHFKAINDAIGIPIIMYNIPGRSIVDINVDTMKRLYELKNIAGVKDATANMARVSQQRDGDGRRLQPALRRGHHRARLQRPRRPRLHLGDVERRAAAVLGIPGGLPEGRLRDRAQAAGQACAAALNLFVETSPAPIKYALSLLGKCNNTLRLPMVPASEKAQAAVRSAMVHAGLIN